MDNAEKGFSLNPSNQHMNSDKVNAVRNLIGQTYPVPQLIPNINKDMNCSFPIYQRMVNCQTGQTEIIPVNHQYDNRLQFYRNQTGFDARNLHFQNMNRQVEDVQNSKQRLSLGTNTMGMRNEGIFYTSNMNIPEFIEQSLNIPTNNLIQYNTNIYQKNSNSESGSLFHQTIPTVFPQPTLLQNFNYMSNISGQNNNFSQSYENITDPNMCQKLSVQKKERKPRGHKITPKTTKNQNIKRKQMNKEIPQIDKNGIKKFSEYFRDQKVFDNRNLLEKCDHKINYQIHTSFFTCTTPSDSSISPSGSMVSGRSTTTPLLNPIFFDKRYVEVVKHTSQIENQMKDQNFYLKEPLQIFNKTKTSTPNNIFPLKKRILRNMELDMFDILENVTEKNYLNEAKSPYGNINKSEPDVDNCLRSLEEGHSAFSEQSKESAKCEQRSATKDYSSILSNIQKTFLPMEQFYNSEDSESEDDVLIIDCDTRGKEDECYFSNNI